MLRQVLLSDRHPPALYYVKNFDTFWKAFPSPAFPQPLPALCFTMNRSVAALPWSIRLPGSLTPDILPYAAWITEAPNAQRTEFQDIFRSGQTPPAR